MEEAKLERDYEEEMYNDENIPEGYFAAAYYRYLKAYFPKKLQNMMKNGELEAEMQKIQDNYRNQLDEEAESQMKHEGVTEELKARNPLEWTQKVNNIRAGIRESIINGLCPYTIDLERASGEDDYDEEKWFEAMRMGYGKVEEEPKYIKWGEVEDPVYEYYMSDEDDEEFEEE